MKAPATSANLGPGFDVFGLALKQPCDHVTLVTNTDKRIRIQVSGIQAETISTFPARNTAGVVAQHMLKEYGLETGLTICIAKGIWPGRGLGSSAASAAAVAYGLNLMFDLGLSDKELIQLAAKGEVVSAGSEHADNVSAAICGGFVILRSYNPLEIITIKPPRDMDVCVAFPHENISLHKTAVARSLLPRVIPIEKLVRNVGSAASMVAGFITGNVDLIGKSMSDVVVEPSRVSLVPGYEQVKKKALEAGACGVAISGAGPAMLAVVNRKNTDPTKVELAMKEGFKSAGFESTAFVSKAGKGTCIVTDQT